MRDMKIKLLGIYKKKEIKNKNKKLLIMQQRTFPLIIKKEIKKKLGNEMKKG